MLKHLQPLPISEEMLGAYLEGNLTPEEYNYVDAAIQDNDSLKGLVEEVGDRIDWTNLSEDASRCQGLDLMPDLQIPEIPTFAIFTGETMPTHILSYPDVAVYAAFEDVDVGDIDMPEIMNTDIEQDGVQDFGNDGCDSTIIMNEDL